MAEQARGTVRLAGVHVLEAYEIELGEAPSDDIDRYFRDIRDLLEREGHEVKGMQHIRVSEVGGQPGEEAVRVPAGWYHFVYPNWLWSHWVYIER